MNVAYKRVLINIPEEMLEELDRAAKREHRMRNEFVREAVRDRIGRSVFKSSLALVRSQAANRYSEAETDRDVELSVGEVRKARKAKSAA